MTLTKQKGIAKPRLTRVSGYAVAALLKATAASGGDITTLLKAAQIGYSEGDFGSGKVSHISRAKLSVLVRDCIQILEQHATESSGHAPMVKDEFELLCFCLITCRDLDEAIHRAARFCKMLEGKGGELTLTYHGSTARFTMTTFRGRQGASSMLSDLLGLSSYHRLFSWLIGQTIEVDRLELAAPDYLPADAILELFHYPVEFGAEQNQFSFPSHFLKQPLVRSAVELRALLTRFPFDLVSSDLSFSGLHETIYAIIKASMLKQEPIPTVDQLASLFNVSSATLRRRLDEAGTSISKAKEACRADWARELLTSSSLSIEDVADKLRFSSAATFRRAFKQWTGHAPSAYRDSAIGIAKKMASGEAATTA